MRDLKITDESEIAKFIDKFGIAKRTKAHGAWFQVKEEEATE
ncbi:hypothetical protein ACXJDW_003183 [Vibrio cholerae]